MVRRATSPRSQRFKSTNLGSTVAVPEAPSPGLSARSIGEMERVSQVLQFPVIVQRCRPFPRELEISEELDLLCGRIAPQRWILKEGQESWLFVDSRHRRPFDELESLRVPGRQAAVQHDLHAECRKVDIPRFDQRIEKRDAVLDRDVED